MTTRDWPGVLVDPFSLKVTLPIPQIAEALRLSPELEEAVFRLGFTESRGVGTAAEGILIHEMTHFLRRPMDATDWHTNERDPQENMIKYWNEKVTGK